MEKCSTWKLCVPSKQSTFLLESYGSDLCCDPQILQDPAETLLPDGSDLMLKMEPEMHQDGLGWKSGHLISCSFLRDLQFFLLEHHHLKHATVSGAKERSKAET